MRSLSQYEIKRRKENVGQTQVRKEVIAALKQRAENRATFFGYVYINVDNFYVLSTRFKKAQGPHMRFVNGPPVPYPNELRYQWVDKLEMFVEDKFCFFGSVWISKKEFLDHINSLPLSIIKAV